MVNERENIMPGRDDGCNKRDEGRDGDEIQGKEVARQ